MTETPPMSDRDVLADKLAECSYEGMSARETADALLEAGVRPPARVIESPEDLDALPIGSVVLHAPCSAEGAVCVWTNPYMAGHWAFPGDDAEYDSEDIICHGLNPGEHLTVLHTPTQEGQADA